MLVFILILGIVAAILEVYSRRDMLGGMTYDIRPHKNAVDPGEEFTLITTVTNLRKLPIAFLRVVEKMPRDIIFPEEREKKLGSGVRVVRTELSVHLSSTLMLLPRERVERRHQAVLPRRGRYFFLGADLTGGDFLGLSEDTGTYITQREIVVLPARPERQEPFAALGSFLGDRSVNRFIMEDPVLTLGVREYTGREPMSAISWTQSARQGNLMVKKYDYTLDLSVTVILNVERRDGRKYAAVEECFSLARGVCEHLEKIKVQYGFVTNATTAGAMGFWSALGDGLGQRHLMTVLEGLGRATYDTIESFESTLSRVALSVEQGRSFVLITPQMAPEYQRGINRLKTLSAGRVCVLEASGEA